MGSEPPYGRGPSVANLVYKRVSTDQQSTARQDLVLAEAGIEDPVIFEEEPGASSRLHPLQRPKFGELLTYARPGDTVHISEMFRLVRGNQHILDVLDVLHLDRLALRIHDGAFSAMDLTARHPRTDELLSTVKFIRQQGRTPPRRRGRADRRRTHRVPRGPLHRSPGPRPPGQPRRDPHGRRRPASRPRHRRGEHARPGVAGHPGHAGQGRRLPPHHRAGSLPSGPHSTRA